MQAITAPYQHQFAKIVCMFGKDILRIAVRHRDGLRGGGKKISSAKNQLSGHITTSTVNNLTLLPALRQ